MTLSQSFKEEMMTRALTLAEEAYQRDEVPVGAVITLGDQVIATGFNQRECQNSPVAHAEILAIQRAAQELQSWRLGECWLFCTLEPCIMCAGALWQARIAGVVYAARDPKGGALGSLIDINQIAGLNHYFPSEAGMLEAASAALLKQFFKGKRSKV